jgi:predicted transcriptional regulator
MSGKTKSKSKTGKTSKTNKASKNTKSTKVKKTTSSREIESIEQVDNIENLNPNESGLVLNEDTLDMLEGMTERLEETTDMAEKVKLHSDISEMTGNIKVLIDGLIKDVDDSKILADPATILPEDLSPGETFDVMKDIHDLETELDDMDTTDDLRVQAQIYAKLQRKCQILKQAADAGDLVIRKCN